MYRSKEDLTLDKSPMSMGKRLLKKRIIKPIYQALGIEPLRVDEQEELEKITKMNKADNTRSTDRLAFEVVRRDSNCKYTWDISNELYQS